MNEYNKNTQKMKEDLEKQFDNGLWFRLGGRKGGLGSS